jgi:hypothetical protein
VRSRRHNILKNTANPSSYRKIGKLDNHSKTGKSCKYGKYTDTGNLGNSCNCGKYAVTIAAVVTIRPLVNFVNIETIRALATLITLAKKVSGAP